MASTSTRDELQAAMAACGAAERHWLQARQEWREALRTGDGLAIRAALERSERAAAALDRVEGRLIKLLLPPGSERAPTTRRGPRRKCRDMIDDE